MARPKGSPTINKAVTPPGRKKGSLDKTARTLVSNEMAHNILQIFNGMGGTLAMLKWAEENPTIFYTQILSRLMPAPMKESEDGPLVSISFGDGESALDAARRVAFILARGAHLAGEDPVQDRVPYAHLAEGPPVPTRPSWMPTEDHDNE